MRHEYGDFCRDWAANFPIFGRKKFTALVMEDHSITNHAYI